jgi:hypothetical protein
VGWHKWLVGRWYEKGMAVGERRGRESGAVVREWRRRVSARLLM